MTKRIILVTGAAGFIGSNIVAELVQGSDFDVVACDWLGPSSDAKWRNLSRHPIFDFVPPGALFQWLADHAGDVELIVHMGAISSTMEPDADKIIENNHVLSRNLFDWCAGHESRLIYASSAATYGDGAMGFEDRDDVASLSALRPLNAYGWSKALFDLYAARQAARGKAPRQWVGLKFFNVYGPNEDHKGSMKSVAAQMWPSVREGKPVRLFKSYRPGIPDGGQLRDFVYVKDASNVVAWLAQAEHVSGVFNLGSGKARSFNDLAHAMYEAANFAPTIEYIEMPEDIRDKYQYFTEARMDKLASAGYNGPLSSLEDGIFDYVRGYLAQSDSYR